jgi:hypothetical protein
MYYLLPEKKEKENLFFLFNILLKSNVFYMLNPCLENFLSKIEDINSQFVMINLQHDMK